MAWLNRLLSPLDRCLMAHGEKEVPPPLFILGAPRSGTTLVYQVVTQNLKVCYFTAVLGYCYGLANAYFRLTHRFLRRPRPVYVSNLGNIRGLLAPSEHANFWLQWFPEDDVRGHHTDPESVDWGSFNMLRDYIFSFSAIAGRPLVVKNLYLALNAGMLARIFPNARFLWVHRDPLLTCQSMLLARRQSGRADTWWSVKIPRYGDTLQKPLWQQVVDQWHGVMSQLGIDLVRFAPGRFIQISYEDLCRSPHGTLDAIEEWLRPCGYEAYADRRLPQSFPLSAALKLSPEEAEDIRSYVQELDRA